MPIMQASGKVKIMLIASIVEFCLIITFLSIGLYTHNLVYVSLYVSISAICNFIISTFLMGRFVLVSSVAKLFKNVLYGVLIAIFCIIPQVVVNHLIPGDFSVLRLIINVVLVMGVAFFTTSWLKIISWKNLFEVIKKK